MKSPLHMKIDSRQYGQGLSAEELRKYRRSRHESQGQFWARFGVTQSRGSRFEKGAEIPKPVAILLELYLNGVVTDGDLKAGHMLVPATKGDLTQRAAAH